MPILDQKSVHSIKTTLYYGQKSQQHTLFSIFHEQITALVPTLCKKCPFSENHCSQIHILSKNVHYLKTLCSDITFVKLFMKIILLSSSNSDKPTLYYGPKSIQGVFFFFIFHVKIAAFMPIFCQTKRPFTKNTPLLRPYFVKKTSIH